MGAKVITVTETLLQYYKITEQCKLCQSMPEKKGKEIKDKDLNGKAILIDNAAKIAEYFFERWELRDYCKEYELPFTMRSTKPKLARSVCRYWIKNDMLQVIRDFTDKAIVHWQERIDKGDKHKPYLYKEMKERCTHLLKLLSKEENK